VFESAAQKAEMGIIGWEIGEKGEGRKVRREKMGDNELGIGWSGERMAKLR
jgi:hypothetical protein